MAIELTVIVPTHNPNSVRLRRTLGSLRQQTLASQDWETLLVDNASAPAIDPARYAAVAPTNARWLHEPELGLTAARRAGLQGALAPVAVLVDDDNVLAPDYLAAVQAAFARHPQVGVAGGKSLPEFENDPPDWSVEFHALLALRNLGAKEMISEGLRPNGATHNVYPLFAPIGAGMALRREAWTAWLRAVERSTPTDRRGTELTSGGDNDIVLSAMKAGWQVAYCPELTLTHLIPASRLEPAYLARLNRGIQKSWMQVLSRHDANPWPPLSRFGARARSIRAWFSYHAWQRPVGYVRWQGACGHFAGRTRRAESA